MKFDMKMIGRHHIRANFYHMVSIIFLAVTFLWYVGLLDDDTSYTITAILFIVDYLAEMFDPHPDNSGVWYKRFFHRAFENGE